MKIEGTLDDMRIIGPSIRPFRNRDLVVCPACGATAHGRWRRTLRKIQGKRDEAVATMRYCQGDKPPSEKAHPFTALMTSRGEVLNGCSGIPEPHLHCVCSNCGATWYTSLKERI